MKQLLSDHDRSRLDQQIAEVEKRTKTQIVLAVVKRSDAYAELPWKAFALGAALAGLLVFILDLRLSEWSTETMASVAAVVTLAGGATFALLTVLVPAFARRFLSLHRAETETHQYAESLFLDRELFATHGRTGVLVLVSLFERRVVLLPDKGLADRLTGDDMEEIIAAMTALLRRNHLSRALEAGLAQLSQTLQMTAPGRPEGENELSNEVVEEDGV
jgi:putative membrane protein